ncbi:MAG: S-layer protein [Candidatus Micrarchaeota archaeon]
MKSMNVKRIAAVASGLTMLGMAFAGAAVSVDTAGVSSFPFFSAGEPNVKVVIGSKAKPEDVVVGANIAAVIGNLAYKTQTVEVLGKDKLGTGGSADGSLTDKQVTLSVTTPGVNPATAYEMKAYVYDDLAFEIDSVRNTSGSSRFSSTNTSFSTQAGPRVIGKDQTSIVGPAAGMASDGKITYPKGSTNTKEEQKIYAFGFVEYDETAKVVQAKYVKTGYEVTFSDPVPVCLDTGKAYTDCTSDSDKLSKGNVEITFLGDKWTIFDYTATNLTITSLTLGKQITRKESFNIDEQVTSPDGYVIVLKDLSAFSPQRAQFDILDKDGKLVKRLYLGEGESSTITEANNIVVKVNKVFPGAFAKQGIADVSLYSSQLVITNDQEISGGDSHKNWKGRLVTGYVGSSIAISKIQLYDDIDQVYKTPVTQTLSAGESIDIIKGMPGYKLNFLGLETVDYDSLTFSIMKSYSLSTDVTDVTVTGNILSLVSGKSNAFQYGSRSVNDVYVVLEPSNGVSVAGQVFYIDANGQYTNTSTTNGVVPYHYSSDEYATLYFNTSFNITPATGTPGVLISIPELTETNNGTTAAHASNWHLNLFYDNAQDQFANALGSSTIDKIGYGFGGAAQNIASKERGYTTYRGNVFTGISSTSASISYAKTVAQARFTLTAGSTTSSGAGNTAAVDLKEGDPYTIGGGYSLKVDKITANVGGTAGDGSIIGLDELKPSVERAAVVTTLMTDTNPLVVLDSQASDTANLIVVGGQIVNSVANAAGVALKSGDQPMVKVYGSTKLVVAGYTAADTSAAGNELIKWLNENRDSVRG